MSTDNKKVTLYYAPGACSISPHIALLELKQDFNAVKVDLATHKTEDGRDFYTISPTGAVPLLELADGTRLAEGVVIAQYIVDNFGDGKTLTPKRGTIEHYRLLEALNFLGTDLHKGTAVLWFAKYGGDAGKYQDYNGAGLKKKFQLVDDRLAKQDYFVGNEFTIADTYLFAICNWLKSDFFETIAGLDFDLSPYKNLAAWYKRVWARPTVQQAWKAEGLPERK